MNNNNSQHPDSSQSQHQPTMNHQQGIPTHHVPPSNVDINLEADEEVFNNYFNFMPNSNQQQQHPAIQPQQLSQQLYKSAPATPPPRQSSTSTVPSPRTPLQQQQQQQQANQQSSNRPAQFTMRVNNNLNNAKQSPYPAVTHSTTPTKPAFNTSAFSSILSPGTTPQFNQTGPALPGGTIVIGNIKFPANPSLAMMPQLNPQLRSTTPTASTSTAAATPEKRVVNSTSIATPTTPITPVVAKEDTGTPKTKSSTTKKRKKKSESPTGDAGSDGEEKKSGKKSSGKKGRTRSKTCKRWTEAQNRALREAVLKYGPRNWKKIAAEIGGMFTADQCNQRWHRVSNPRIIKGDWTPEEDDLLFALVQQHSDKSWTKVAEGIPGRTDIQCRHRFFQRKKEIEMGVVRSSSTPTRTPSTPGTSTTVMDSSTAFPPSQASPVPTTLNSPLFNSPSISSPKVVQIDNNGTSSFIPQQPQSQPPQQQIIPQQLPSSDQQQNDELSSMDIKDYRKYSRHFTNYGKRSGELSSDMSNFSYVEDEAFSDYEDNNSNFNMMDIDLFAKEEELLTPTTSSSKDPMAMDEDDEQGLEIDIQEEVSPVESKEIRVVMTPSSSGNSISVQLIAVNQLVNSHVGTSKQFDKLQDAASGQIKKPKTDAKKSSVNRMRGNLNVHIPWSESEESILKRECLAYGPDKVPDFASILTNHSQSFHPLHTPDVLRKHYLQLKAAGVDFSNPVDSIPPDAQYFDDVLESELGLINPQKKAQIKKERKKKEPKEPKEKKPRKKKEESTEENKKEKKARGKRKAKDISVDDEVKSTATDRFGGKRKKTSGRATKKAKTDDEEERSAEHALFVALDILNQPAKNKEEQDKVTDLAGLAHAAEKARTFEEEGGEKVEQSEDQMEDIPESNPPPDNDEILLNFSHFVTTATKQATDDVPTDTTNGSQQKLLSDPTNLRSGERNVTYRLVADPSESEKPNGLGDLANPFFTSSNKISIREIGNYLKEKFGQPRANVVIWFNGKILNEDLKLDTIMSQYGITHSEDLELLYESR